MNSKFITIISVSRQEEQQLTTCKASEDKPEAPHGWRPQEELTSDKAADHSLRAYRLSPEDLGAPLPGDSKEGGGTSQPQHRKQVDSDSTGLRTLSSCGKACHSLSWQQSAQTSGPNSSLSCSPGARPEGSDGDAVPTPKAISMGK